MRERVEPARRARHAAGAASSPCARRSARRADASSRYLLAESALLAFGAAAVGIALACVGIGVLRGLGADYVPRAQEIALDGRPSGAARAALTAASALLFGLVPALHGTGGAGGRVAALARAARPRPPSRPAAAPHRSSAAQFAIATPLLIVAGLLLASLHQLGRVDLGFDTRNS